MQEMQRENVSRLLRTQLLQLLQLEIECRDGRKRAQQPGGKEAVPPPAESARQPGATVASPIEECECAHVTCSQRCVALSSLLLVLSVVFCSGNCCDERSSRDFTCIQP